MVAIVAEAATAFQGSSNRGNGGGRAVKVVLPPDEARVRAIAEVWSRRRGGACWCCCRAQKALLFSKAMHLRRTFAPAGLVVFVATSACMHPYRAWSHPERGHAA